MGEVRFCVHVDEAGGTYGVTLFADPGEDVEADEVPCFRSCFTGEPGLDVQKVVELFASCHQDAMEELGLSGSVSPARYAELLTASVELAGVKMALHGLTAVRFEDVPEDVLYALFAESLPDGENAPGSDLPN